jgi:hypothetical protein
MKPQDLSAKTAVRMLTKTMIKHIQLANPGWSRAKAKKAYRERLLPESSFDGTVTPGEIRGAKKMGKFKHVITPPDRFYIYITSEGTGRRKLDLFVIEFLKASPGQSPYASPLETKQHAEEVQKFLQSYVKRIIHLREL